MAEEMLSLPLADKGTCASAPEERKNPASNATNMMAYGFTTIYEMAFWYSIFRLSSAGTKFASNDPLTVKRFIF
jgi:hypothetical protein